MESIPRAYTKSTDSVGMANIPQKDITIKEIKRVMETALYNPIFRRSMRFNTFFLITLKLMSRQILKILLI